MALRHLRSGVYVCVKNNICVGPLQYLSLFSLAKVYKVGLMFG